MSVENFAQANSPPTEQAHAVLARSRSCCHRATTSTVVRRFFRGTASLYIFSILFSRKSRVPLDAAFSYLFLFIPRLFFLPQGLFLPPGFIPSLLFFTTGIISATRIHLYLALFFRRDYFFCSDASLSCSFPPQGLLRPPGFIPSLLFCAAGMISSAQIHLYLALFLRKDYFFRPDSSLSCSFSPQGLFLPPECIPSLLFCAAEITFSARIHPYLALLCCRDDFFRSDASPARSFVPQGLLFLPGFIPILLFCAAGMISSALMHPQLAFFTTGITSSARIHPQLALFFHRDYFRRPDSSPACSSSAQIHLYLALLCCRDDFFCSDASPACFFLPQGLFLPLRCISILLFFSAGITSSAQMHLYLALFLRRDYCDRPDSSPACFFVLQG